MIDYARFTELVRDALLNLHDPAALQAHPIRRLLAQEDTTLAVEDLQRLLIDTIRQLRPLVGDSDSSVASTVQWRRYRYLWLRYVEGMSLSQIAESLGVTERQSRRHHRDGLDAVSHSLWIRHRGAQWSTDPIAEAISGEDEIAKAALTVEISRLSAELPPGPSTVDETLGSALDAMAELVERGGLDLRVAVPPGLPPVAVNRIFLRQVFLSLLSHLVRFGPGSRAVIAGEQADDAVILRTDLLAEGDANQCPIHDSPGIQPERPQGGDPIDLARRVLEAQGGSIDILTSAGSEIQILMRLPAAYDATVLVVDDNPDFLTLFHRCLEGSSYRVIETSIATEAIKLARESKPDVIVLDVLMPSQDGWELLGNLRRDPQVGDLPVLVCSVLRDPVLALGLGASGFLPKPVTRLQLLTALEKARTTRRGSSDSP